MSQADQKVQVVVSTARNLFGTLGTKVLILGLVVLGLLGWASSYYVYRGARNTERQLRGDLTERERKLQDADEETQRVRSQLVEEETLRKEIQNLQGLQADELERLRKKYGLLVDSVTRIQASLSEMASGTGTTTATQGGVVRFEWLDSYKRFHLIVPDIYKPDGAIFTYDQKFILDMVAFRQPSADGSLRIQRVDLSEVDATGVVIAKANLDYTNSSFRYSPLDTSPGGVIRNRFLLGVTTNSEATLAWEPYRPLRGSLGFGVALFGGNGSAGAGGSVQWYPHVGWVHSEIGVGVLGGYTTDGKWVVRGIVAIPIAVGKK